VEALGGRFAVEVAAARELDVEVVDDFVTREDVKVAEGLVAAELLTVLRATVFVGVV